MHICCRIKQIIKQTLLNHHQQILLNHQEEKNRNNKFIQIKRKVVLARSDVQDSRGESGVARKGQHETIYYKNILIKIKYFLKERTI